MNVPTNPPMVELTTATARHRRALWWAVPLGVAVFVLSRGLAVGAAVHVAREDRAPVSGQVDEGTDLAFLRKAVAEDFLLGTTRVEDLKAGDCYDRASDSETDISFVERVACDRPHDEQVIAVIELEMRTHPDGEDGIIVVSYERCLDEVREFVGAPLPQTSLGVGFLYPTPDQLRAGDGEVTCTVWDGRDGRASSTAMGIGADPSFLNYLALEPGDCFDGDFHLMGADRAECTAPHDGEVIAVFDLPDTDWPGRAAAEALVDTRCQQLYEEAVASGDAPGGLFVDYLYPIDLDWLAGVPQACSVRDFDESFNGPLTDSGVLR